MRLQSEEVDLQNQEIFYAPVYCLMFIDIMATLSKNVLWNLLALKALKLVIISCCWLFNV